MNPIELIKLASTPAACEEANHYRSGMLKYRDLFLKEREDRMHNLNRLLPSVEWREREQMRLTLRALENDYREHHQKGMGI